MPRFDGTGPQGKGAMGACRNRQCDDKALGQSEGFGRGNGGRQRQRNQNRICGFRLVGAGQNSGFVQACIERLETKIQSMQERLARLKTEFGM